MAIEWLVENVRLSLFSNAAVQVTEADWQKLTGQQMADNRQAVPGGHVFAGRYEEAQLSLAGTVNRADMIMTSPPRELADEPELPTFGPWKETRDKFVQLTKKWQLGERFPVVRIAFGAVLLSKADSRVDAYKHLKDLLCSVTVNPDEMRDFTYRINWPVASNVVQGLAINRLTNWSALQFHIQRLALDGHGQVGAAAPAFKNAVRLELDHSTDAGRKEAFVSNVVEKIYDELVRLASDNAEKGEKP